MTGKKRRSSAWSRPRSFAAPSAQDFKQLRPVQDLRPLVWATRVVANRVIARFTLFSRITD
jgi:hypothetical protein